MSESLSFSSDFLDRKLERMHNALLFDELLELSEAICLTNTPNRQPTPPPATNSTTQLGIRGIRTAFDILTFGARGTLDSDQSPLTTPEQFSDEADSTVLRKAEAFGEQLIEQAFVVLGPDAYAMADAYKQAESPFEQCDVITWLDQRLLQLRTDDSEQSDNPAFHTYYHPARLSPKLIGNYPDNNLTPSCLGMATIAASFFRYVGADFLYGDVDTTTYCENSSLAAAVLSECATRMTASGAPEIADILDRKSQSLYDDTIATTPFHAALYVKLLNDQWLQFDPYLNCTTAIITSGEEESLTAQYEKLCDTKEIAPGLTLPVDLRISYGPSPQFASILYAYKPDTAADMPQQLIDHIKTGATESFGQTIFDDIIDPLFAKLATQGKSLQRIIDQQRVVDERHDYRDFPMQEAFYKVFEKYFLWNTPIEEVVARCNRDQNYLAERCADLVRLPVLLIAQLTIEATRHDFEPQHCHIDAGLPAIQIGLATLNSIATHTTNTLPPSFWLTHWPSRVSVITSASATNTSPRDNDMLYSNMKHLAKHPLTMYGNYSNIITFLYEYEEGDTHA